jgi:FAD/FMN-containing dehydrogenase
MAAPALAELLAALERVVGPSGLVTDAEALAPRLADWRGAFQGRAPCLVRPASTDETAAVLRLLGERGRAVVPQAGNTGLCGGATPDGSGQQILVSLDRMSRLRRVDPDDNLLVAEAGCVLADVQEAADAAGRLFPLSLAAEGTAQIGGLLSTNAGGTAVLRYGMARDLVLGIEAVLPSGEIFAGLRGLRKDNTGYDLKQLFVGAEGTLGLVSAATLKLFPRPREVVTALVAVPDVGAAVKLLRFLQDEVGDNVTTFELIGDAALRMLLSNVPGLQSPFGRVPACTVLVEVASFWRDFEPRGAFEATLGRAAEVGLAEDAVIASNATQAAGLWKLREQIPEAERRAGPSVKHDISVTPAAIPGFLRELDQRLAVHLPGSHVVVFGHLGDGSLHLNVAPPGLEGRVPPELHDRVWALVHGLVTELGGSISSEHGIGQLKRAELWRLRPALDRRLMQGVKALLDPAGLMNPGKIL